MTELLPCPFCGGEAKLKTARDYYFVVCMSEDCDAHCTWMYDQDKAIAAWNRRTPLPDDERATLAAKVAELEQQLSDTEAWGQACDDVRIELEVQSKERIAELEAQLAQAQAGRWVVVDILLKTSCSCDNCTNSYGMESESLLTLHNESTGKISVVLPDNIRLCRWQEGSEA